ncbi:MAG: hypothetical protein OXC08_16380 [Thiotrichales bacterium]|nr:hypothetical protein [Thiotrichales bacterium]
MARARRTGLTVPRLGNAEAQRAFEQIIDRLNSLDTEIAKAAAAASPTTGTGGGGPGGGPGTTTPGPVDPEVPNLPIPPTPVGVMAACGIGIVILSWGNPRLLYSNHARALIFRNTADAFDTAAEVGQSEGFIWTDRDVEGETEYFYWIVFESTTSVRGQPSEVVSCTPHTDPGVLIDEISALVRNDPFARELDSPITTPGIDPEQANRVRLLVAELLTTSLIEDVNTRVTRLSASAGGAAGVSLGPEQNTFTGAAEAAAEAARDAYAQTNPLLDDGVTRWFDAYKRNPNNAILLQWE